MPIQSEQIGQAAPAHAGRLLRHPVAPMPRRDAGGALADIKQRLATGNAALLAAAAGGGIFCAGAQDVFEDINDAARGAHTLIFGRAPSPFGDVFAAASERGLCALQFIDGKDDAAAARAALQKRWPQARLRQDAAAAAQWARRAFDCSRPQSSVPLHVRGTKFQIKTWLALMAIPAGSAASYAALAQAVLGAASGARAVAGAAAANPIAALIPCHRLLRSDGALAGYAWGVARKRGLLAAEFSRAPVPVFPPILARA